jgi:beta-mannosidase
MFAGAMYPSDGYFIQNIQAELRDNIKRLRKHPCIVLWCGNNEIDEAWHNWGWQKQFNLNTKQSNYLWQEYKKLFEETIPAILKELDPERPYIASSPIHGWGRKESMTHGDSHYWGMWWGVQSIDTMKSKIPRFMSEYGMQAMPSIESIKEYAIPTDFDTASIVIKIHQKHPTGYNTLNAYLQQEKLSPTTFEEYVQATQELQARALKTTIESQLNSKGRCMGNLFWQFNDCWPVCSWSVIDYYGRKKKAYEVVKEIYNEK